MINLYPLLKPVLYSIEPESAHDLALLALKYRLTPHYRLTDLALSQNICGIRFDNPLGLAAGFDKNAVAMPGLFDLGFGAIEVGTITRCPQSGNPKPRVFRDTKSHSIINRMGFPGQGLDAVLPRLKSFKSESGILGVNIGINKDSKAPLEDYKFCMDYLAPYADYITVNISSPNTAGLRDWQAGEALDKLLSALTPAPKPLFVKVSPDMTEAQRVALAQVALDKKIQGLIVSNTTLSRPDYLPDDFKAQTGGLSGPPVRDLALQSLRHFYQLCGGRLVLVGVGGISSAQDAFERLSAGASLLQIYTGLVYQGPAIVARILEGLVQKMHESGFKSVVDVVGTGAAPAKKVI